MKRRQFVSTTGAATLSVALTGCMSNNRDTSKDCVEILTEEFYKTEAAAGVRGKVKNVFEWELGYLELQATFVDSSGTKIGQGVATVNNFASQTTWEYNIKYNTTRANKITDYKLRITDLFQPPFSVLLNNNCTRTEIR